MRYVEYAMWSVLACVLMLLYHVVITLYAAKKRIAELSDVVDKQSKIIATFPKNMRE